MNGCSDPYKTYYFLKELDEVFQMEINKLLRFWFLAEVNINLQEMHYCWQFKDYDSGRKKGNLLLFCLIFIFVFEKCQSSFSMGTPFGPFWSVKYLDFGGESCEIKILSHSIQEIYTLRKVKNQVSLFHLSWEPKPVWFHGWHTFLCN